MFTILKLEDSTVIAEWQDGQWQVTLSDAFSGIVEHKVMTCLELASIMALAIGNDDPQLAGLYEFAEPAVAGLAPEVRPMP